MADAGVKSCSVCGIDVSGKPRVKDAAGRYMCSDCVQKAKAARGAQTAPKPKPPVTTTAAPTGEEDNSFLLNLGGQESMAAKGVALCQECGRALNHGAVVCVGCGFNTATGKRLQVKVLKAEKVKAEKGSTSSGGGGLSGTNPHLIGVGIVAMFVLLGAAGMYVPGVFIGFLIVAMMGSVAAHIWAIVDAWQNTTWKGVLILAASFVGILALYELYYVAVEAESVVLKWLWFTSLLAFVAALLMNSGLMDAVTK